MNGNWPSNADLATDSELVCSYTTGPVEAGRDIAVLMHSYGGQVGTFGIDSDQSCATNYPREGLVDGPSDPLDLEVIKEFTKTIGRWNGKSLLVTERVVDAVIKFTS